MCSNGDYAGIPCFNDQMPCQTQVLATPPELSNEPPLIIAMASI